MKRRRFIQMTVHRNYIIITIARENCTHAYTRKNYMSFRRLTTLLWDLSERGRATVTPNLRLPGWTAIVH